VQAAFGSGDALPDWTGEATKLLATKLAAPELGLAPIEIRVDPEIADTRVNVVGFPPDEAFVPQTIHLAAGSYELTATAPGRPEAHARVMVSGSAPVVVTLTLPPAARPDPHAFRLPEPPTVYSTKLWIGAGIAAALGVGLHLWASNDRDVLQDAYTHGDTARWDDRATRFKALRIGTIVSYGLATIGMGAGILARLHEHYVRTSIYYSSIEDTGVLVGVSWQR
jgi:hypothetical protein